MKNFNNDDIDKYQKAANRMFGRLPKLTGSMPLLTKIKINHILKSAVVVGATYLYYKYQNHNKFRRQHYIDLFQAKKQIANKIRSQDLWNKLKSFDFNKNRDDANANFEDSLKKQIQFCIQNIKPYLKVNDKNNESKQIMKSDRKSKENRNKFKQDTDTVHSNMQQLIISKDIKYKLRIGEYFRLHTKQYLTTISNTKEYRKTTLIYPFQILDTPFFAKKKQQVKQIGKKQKLQNFVGHKQKFNFASECQTVNYWNILALGKKVESSNEKYIQNVEQRKQDQQNTGKKQEISQQQKIVLSNKKQIQLKKILLFQCRNRIKKLEDELTKKLGEKLDSMWNRQSNLQNIHQSQNNSFQISTWDKILQQN